jgi:hypothetical protein
MPTTLQQDALKEYGTAKGWRIFIYLFGPPLILLFLYAPIMIRENNQQAPDTVLIWSLNIVLLAMGVFLAYCLVVVGKGRFIISNDRLIERNVWPFNSKEILLADVAGFRFNEQFTCVFARAPNKTKLKFGYTTESYAELQQWLADRFPDLDAQEQQEAEAALLADETLGQSEAERRDQLSTARRTVRILTIAGGAATAWLFLQPEPYQWAILSGLIVPILCLPALWLHPKVLRVDEKKNSGYPSVALPLLLPTMALLLRSVFDHDLLSHDPVWPMVASVAGCFGLLLMMSNRYFLLRKDSRWLAGSSIIFYAGLYGYSATTTYNFAFDDARPAIHEVKVMGKHKSGGKSTTYYLTVEAWGPKTELNDVTVSADYYEQVGAGKTVTILLMPGKLEMPWYTVAE